MMVHYVREGLSKERLYLTGAAADDILAATLSRRAGERQKLEEQLGMPRGRPLLLCAPPPDQFVFYGMQSEFPTYAALLAAWINELEMLEGWNVVVRPHPRELNRPIPTSERTNVVISRADTASLVPLADLYVASISATIRWAIACGIPVVNYDAYRVGYTDYDGVTAVVRVETLSTFSLALGRFSNESYRADMMNSQRLVSSEWGELDGRSMQRTLELLRTTGSSRSAEN
jgi:hypothetical protein